MVQSSGPATRPGKYVKVSQHSNAQGDPKLTDRYLRLRSRWTGGAAREVLGMIRPGVRAALAASQGKRLGVWGTAITVNSRLYDQLVEQENPDVEVLGVAPTTLLRLAEYCRHPAASAGDTTGR